MSITKTGIVNMALRHLGSERVNSINDDEKGAEVMLDFYDISRKSALEAHPWNFAIKRANLSRLNSTPEFGYAYEYQLPADCLRVLKEENDNRFEREGRVLLTNEDKLEIIYISDATNAGDFSTTFVDYFALELAWKACYTITQDKGLKDALRQEKMDMLGMARSYSAQEDDSDRDIDARDFLNARFGPGYDGFGHRY